MTTHTDPIHDLIAHADSAALRALLVLAIDAGYSEATGRPRARASHVDVDSWLNAACNAWYAAQEALSAQAAAADDDREVPAWLLALPGVRRES